MNTPAITEYQKIHPDFLWNEKYSTKEELQELTQEYIASEKPYLQEIGYFFRDWLNTDTTIEVQTSGSTGKPKRFRVKKQYMVNSALATGDFFRLPAQTKALLCLPATYIAGKLMIVRALILGWKIDSVKPQANPLSSSSKVYDFCAMTPYQLGKSFHQLNRVKKIMVGGGAVSHQLLLQIQNSDTEIFETYAMTETLTHIAARKISTLGKALQKPPFKTLNNVQIQQGKDGCLIINAPKVNEETIYTHDLVKLKDQHSFWLEGRIDNIINSGGIKIQPEIVEKELGKLITDRYFVAGQPDKELGEKLILIIEQNLTEEEEVSLKRKIKKLKALTPYQVPKKIYGLNKFKETHTGKINRGATLKLIHL